MADTVYFSPGQQDRIRRVLDVLVIGIVFFLIGIVFFLIGIFIGIVFFVFKLRNVIMPIDVPDSINEDKNKLETQSAWLWLLDITVPGVEEVIRLVNNTEDVVYDGNTYAKWSFKLGPWEYTVSGELPYRTLNITNIVVTEHMLPYVEEYNGAIGSTVVTTPVNSEHLDIDMSSKAMEFTIINVSSAEEWIAFKLGAPSPLIQQVPKDKYFANYCRCVDHFKGAECGYEGEEPVCDGTLAQCKEFNNETRFGGEPGLRSKTVRFAW